MSIKLTKLYNSAQQILPHLKSFDKSLPKTSVVLKNFLKFHIGITKTLIDVLKTRQKFDEIYKDK